MIESASLNGRVGMVYRDRYHDDEVQDAEADEQGGDGHAVGLQHRDEQGRSGHEQRIEHVDGGDHARAPVGAGPGLHRGEGRHDEQAAADRKTDQRDRDLDAATGLEDFRGPRNCLATGAPQSVKPMNNEKMPRQRAPSIVGSRMMRPAQSQAASPDPTATAIENTAR